MGDIGDTGTWHYGLVARWWAEFNAAEDEELDYLRAAIERYGQPALDLGCGNGRLLLPLLEDGFAVDGADVSADMIEHARAAASRAGHAPTLAVQPTHELDMPRRYRVIFMIGAFGIGGDRRKDMEGLARAHRHLEPGGVLLINHELPYAELNEEQWQLWLPGRRDTALPRPWPEAGGRRRAADGDEIELISRTLNLDPLAQRLTFEMLARLWRDDAIVQEETRRLHISLYFAQEIVQLLHAAGFEEIQIEGGYSGRPATPDDGIVMFVARKR